jgi:drug/metabolite transporter (DMT)-like permease
MIGHDSVMQDGTPAPLGAARGGAVDWAVFFALGTMWGSSYLFIKIGVETITPFTLVALRLAIGAALLAAVVVLRRVALPRSARMYGHLLVLSVFSVVLPFSLITWAEQSVTSSLASILTATVPLFVIVIAAVALPDEGITANRVIGLLIGFAGVVILTGGPGGGGELVPQLALLGAAASYAIGGVYGRRTVTGLAPIVPAVVQVTFALVLSASLALAFERPFELEYPAAGIGSLLWLGLVGTGLAYLAFFRLLRRIGATRTSLVAYVMPVVGIVLGALVIQEPVTVPMIIGTVLVIGGIGLVNLQASPAALLRRTVGQRPAA